MLPPLIVALLPPVSKTLYVAGLTVTEQLAFFVLSELLVAVMFAVPAPTAVTRPFGSTVATLVSSLDHVTDLSVAPSGLTVAVSVSVSPTVNVVVVLLRDTPVTSTVVGLAYP